MVESRGNEFQAVVACMVSLAFIAVCLRLYVRIWLTKAFGWDDGCMVVAMITHIAFAASAILGVHYGYGRHTSELAPEQIYPALRSWWLCYIFYCITMICAKVSIGLFLLRITPSRAHTWIIYIAVGCTVVTGFAFLFVTLFQCTPFSYLWGQSMREKGKCIDVKVIAILTYLYSIFSTLSDFAFGILPIILVWNLNMNRRQKIVLIPVLSMGCLACVAVVARMAYIPKFITNDFMYDTVDIALWSDIEQGLAIAAGSLGTLHPLYKAITARLGFSATGPSKRDEGNVPYFRSTSSDANKRKKKGTLYNITAVMNDEQEEDEIHVLGACRNGAVITEDSGWRRYGESDGNDWAISRMIPHEV